MKLEKLSIDGKIKDTIEVLDKIFSAKVNNKLVSSVLYKTNANYKGRHAKTKQQNEVSGPTSKIYAQKGTGGARHSSRKAPIFVGGGVAHGSKGAVYKIKKINKKIKKLGILHLLSQKSKAQSLFVVEDFKTEITKTKQQNEIKGSTSKIFAQKGTGGARHASRKAPIFVGGGVAHGPKGELAYKKRKLNKIEKKQSVASLITEKNNNKNLLILNDFSSEIKKTKEMNSIIKKFEITNSLIILDKNSKNKIEKSVRNIPNVKVTDVNHFSSYDIIKFKKVVFTESSVKELEKRYS